MQPIPTYYKGYKFRSRLEARWAIIFDALGVESWEYEPEGFVLSDGTTYLPDFKIKVNCRRTDEDGYVWVEVKGVNNYYDISITDRAKIELFEKPLIVLGNLDAESDCDGLLSFRFIDGDSYPANFSVHSGKVWICGADYDEYDCDRAWNHAVKQAKRARFEHGENPDVAVYKQADIERDYDLAHDLMNNIQYLIENLVNLVHITPDEDFPHRGELYIEIMALISISAKYDNFEVYDPYFAKFLKKFINEKCYPFKNALDKAFAYEYGGLDAETE